MSYEQRSDLNPPIKDEDQAKFEELNRLTREQDTMQLRLGRDVDYSPIALIEMELVNKANAVILEISRWKGNEVPVVEHGYLEEKIIGLVKTYNALVHDYNLIYGTDYEPLDVPGQPREPTKHRVSRFRSEAKTSQEGRGWWRERQRHSEAARRGRR